MSRIGRMANIASHEAASSRKPLAVKLPATDSEIATWYQSMTDAGQDPLLVDRGPLFDRNGARKPGRCEQIACGGRPYGHEGDADRWWWMRDHQDAVKAWLKAQGHYRPFGSAPLPLEYQPAEVFCFRCLGVSTGGALGLRPDQYLIVSWTEPAEPGNLVVVDLDGGEWAIFSLATPDTLTTDQGGFVDLLDGDRVYRVTAIGTPAPGFGDGV